MSGRTGMRATQAGASDSTGSGDGPRLDVPSADPPEDECNIPTSETAAVTGTIAGEATQLGYAWFGAAGGGNCPDGYLLMLVPTLADFTDNIEELPNPTTIPRIETFISDGDCALANAPLPAGEYTTFSSAYYLSAGWWLKSTTITLTEPMVFTTGATLEGTVSISLSDPSVELSGTFSAQLCTDMSTSGDCGA